MSHDSQTENRPSATITDVVRGGGNHLFLVGGAHRVMQYVTGELDVRDGIKRIFKENLKSRKAFCGTIGASYAHVVCPDKHSVMNRHFPLPINIVLGQMFKQYCGELFSFPLEELRSADGGETYWKTDTHWNLSGMLVFVRESLLSLGLDKNAVDKGLSDIPAECCVHERFSGDLGSKMQPREYEAGIRFRRPADLRCFSNNITGSNGTINISINPKIDSGKLLIFGDSFAMSCVDLFALFFRETFLVRSAYFHREIARMFMPTHVLSSNVERYLPNVPTDRQAPLALLIPQLSNKEVTPDAGFYEAVDALLQPGSLNYERFYRTKLGFA